MPDPLVSIVVLSWNRPRSTCSTLRALAEVPSGVPREVIVVDNGSGTPTVDALKAFRDQGLIDRLVLLTENTGTSPGYNAGFRTADARSSFLTKLDNDIEVLTPGWLKSLVKLLDASPSVGIASPEIVNHVGIQEQPVFRLETGHQVRDWIGCPAGGGGMTFRRSLYEEIGGFRENYGEGLLLMPDDLEFFFRVRERGLKGYYAHAVRSRTIDHLEVSHADYGAFKRRQYHLLHSRFFAIAQSGARVFQPYLASAEVGPPRITRGRTIHARCTVAAADRRKMVLGCAMVSAETNDVVDCRAIADIETAAPRTAHELSLRIPTDLPTGPYVVRATLWTDPGAAELSRGLADLVQTSQPIEVTVRPSTSTAREKDAAHSSSSTGGQ